MTDIIDRLENASYQNAPSRCFEAANEIKRLRGLITTPAQACAVRLEARPADNSKEWTEIFPAQLEWVAKEGHQVRAIELAAQPPAAPVETDDYTWYDAYNKLSAAYMGLIAERDAGAQCSADNVDALTRKVAVLLARHDYRFGMGGSNETEYAFARSHAFEKRAAEVVALMGTFTSEETSVRAHMIACLRERTDDKLCLDAADELDALTLAQPQGVVWQTMETAPQDGTEVIGIHVRDWDGMFKTTVYGPWTMMFEGGKWVPSWNGFNVIRYMSDFGTEYQDFDGEPTHWQPMPPSSMTRPHRVSESAPDVSAPAQRLRE